MDITTIIGMVLGLVSLVGGFMLEGGHLGSLWIYTAAIIVFGGTFGAVIVSFPMSSLKDLPKAFGMAFKEPKRDPGQIIDEIVDMATIARREGVLALEQRAQEHTNPFLKEGLLMVVDGTDPELTRQIMELEMEAIESKHEGYAKIFEAAGGYAPTIGIIGTVLGLIHVLGNLSDPDSLGPKIAVAFTATLYGVASANVLYLPVGTKIKMRSKALVSDMELMLEGILALQAGENPQLIKKKLTSFLHDKDGKNKARAGGEGNVEEK
ncbi:flagellar motor protein [Gorillibacterium sp. CAU 1737]|uniref:flagellar motor protein n=1 Tax=Gorillibacterium sp. CAU 1737 TaxID=3140362 RepID=UPI00325FEFE4